MKPDKIYLAELVENGRCYPEWQTKPFKAVHKNHEYVSIEKIVQIVKEVRDKNTNNDDVQCALNQLASRLNSL